MSEESFMLCNLKRQIAIERANKGSTPLEVYQKRIKKLERLIKLIVPPQYDSPCKYCGHNNPYHLTLHEELDDQFEKTGKKVVVCEDCHNKIHEMKRIMDSDHQAGFKKDLAKLGLQMMTGV
jgi:hypothetical protein